MTDPTTFGGFLRSLRTARKVGLRMFAQQVDMKPSNLSNLECGRINPPQDASVLHRISQALGLNADDTARLNELAVAHKTNTPAPDVARYVGSTQGVPVLLRTMSERSLTSEQIAELQAEIESRYPRDE